LLALHAIGMVGVARQHGQIERSPPARSPGRETARSAPSVPRRSCGARRRTRPAGPGSGDGRSTRALHHQPGFGCKQHGGNAAASQGQGSCQPHRAGTDHNHAIVRHAKKRSPHAAFSIQGETPPARRLQHNRPVSGAKISGALRLDDRPALARGAPDNDARQDRCRNLTPHVQCYAHSVDLQ
jgi:hypothetical protein